MENLQQRLINTLVQDKKINRKKLLEAHTASETQGIPAEQAMVDAGVVTRERVLEVLQQITGIPTVDLRDVRVKSSVAQIIPREMSDRFRLLCVAKHEGKIIAAMVDPTDSFAIEFVKMRTGLEVETRVCYIGDLAAAVERAYAVQVAYIGKDTPMKSDEVGAGGQEEKPKGKFVIATPDRSPRASLVSQGQVQKKAEELRAIRLDGFRTTGIAAPGAGIAETREAPLRALLEVGKDLASTLETDVLVRKILQNAIALTQSEGASLILIEESGNQLYFKESLGTRSEEIKSVRFPLDEHSVAGYAIQNRKSLRINDVVHDPRHNKTVDKAVNFITRSIVCVPVTWRGEPIGVITSVNKSDNQQFTQEDEEYLEILASQAAIALHNSAMMERLHNFYTESVGMLIDVLEHSDVISRDHMVDVARFSTLMGQHINLSAPEIERLCYAGLLHDIGKIKCEDPLDPEHAAKGAEMLARVRLFGDLPPLVRCHHECHDGSGYPDGVKEDEIPILARILAVAEAWVEALSERGQQNRSELMLEMRNNFGSRFDPDLRPAFEYAVQATLPGAAS
ncbi:MAG: GAF domain-containing protein [Armatimonadetes bacterium]|nr:GAF domain-containing protein [Armatimonadota bacterium]